MLIGILRHIDLSESVNKEIMKLAVCQMRVAREAAE